MATGPAMWTSWLDSLFAHARRAARPRAVPRRRRRGHRGASARRCAKPTLSALARGPRRRAPVRRRRAAALPRRRASPHASPQTHDSSRSWRRRTGADEARHPRSRPAPWPRVPSSRSRRRTGPRCSPGSPGRSRSPGLDILGADAYPAPDGLALDVFTVTSATRAPIEHETFVTLERLVRAALRDRLELATRLKERRRHYRPTLARPGPRGDRAIGLGHDAEGPRARSGRTAARHRPRRRRGRASTSDGPRR